MVRAYSTVASALATGVKDNSIAPVIIATASDIELSFGLADAAYGTKYRRYAANIISSIVSPKARSATIN
jgi:hypothetical protein